jgi:hypothetical protein
VVFGRGRLPRTQSQQLMDELTQSYGHLRLAAAHVAGGAAEKLTPPYDKARNVAARGWASTRGAFTPLYEQMRVGAANARKEYDVPKRSRWPMLVGLLAAGAAAGAAGAMVMRRRRAVLEWEDYSPAGPIEEGTFGVDEPAEAGEPRTSATKKVAGGAATVAGSVASQAAKLADSLNDKADRSGAPGGSPPRFAAPGRASSEPA